MTPLERAREASRRNDNEDLRQACAELAIARGRTPIEKPVSQSRQLDKYTRMAIEAYAAAQGLTFEEAVTVWLQSHATYHHYRTN